MSTAIFSFIDYCKNTPQTVKGTIVMHEKIAYPRCCSTYLCYYEYDKHNSQNIRLVSKALFPGFKSQIRYNSSYVPIPLQLFSYS